MTNIKAKNMKKVLTLDQINDRIDKCKRDIEVCLFFVKLS